MQVIHVALPQIQVASEPLEDVERAFVSRVAIVKGVQRVVADTTPRGKKLWTIVDKSPSGRDLRRRVYKAEMEVLELFPDACVEFRLVNLAELLEPEAFHVPQGVTIYERQPH